MKKVQFITALVLIVAAAFAAMGFFTFRNADNQKDVLFSTDRAVEDIRRISARPHSIEHPVERAQVRWYLHDRLEDMGGKPQIFYYDSIPCKFGGTLNIANVYCKLEPRGRDTSDAYLMLVAHLDSRFTEQTPEGETLSYGAADDGYGLAAILELTRGALTYAREWNQGLKILFTDAEEHELDGMRYALEKNNQLFDRVGLLINLEARGVKGPALLFETSGGNAALMDFYTENARMPYTYSLTSVIYGFMPNFTDFTPARRLFPGYNFSVIDNLHFYHNDRDCFSNIHPESVAHYGVQLEPMLRKYLTDKEYADPDYFRSGEDRVAFTVPGIKTFCLTQKDNIILNAVVLLMFCLAMVLYIGFGRARFGKVLLNAFWILVTGLLAAGAATGAVWAAAKIAGVPFSLTALKFLSWDGILALALTAVMAVAYVIFFLHKSRKSENFVFEHLLGLVLLMLILSGVLLFTTGENFFLIFPAACALTGLLLHVILYLNILSLPLLLLAEMAFLPFLYNVYTALTVGALGIVMFLAFLYTVLTASLVRCFMTQRR